jgi:hypothetical protein
MAMRRPPRQRLRPLLSRLRWLRLRLTPKDAEAPEQRVEAAGDVEAAVVAAWVPLVVTVSRS